MLKYFCFGMVIFVSAFAILPPFYESRNEIVEIINHPMLEKILGSGEPILEIKKVDRGYQIRSLKTELFVEVEYLRTQMIGPQQYTLHFSLPRSIETKE